MKIRDTELATVAHALSEQLAITQSALSQAPNKNALFAESETKWRTEYEQREIALRAILARLRKYAQRTLAKLEAQQSD